IAEAGKHHGVFVFDALGQLLLGHLGDRRHGRGSLDNPSVEFRGVSHDRTSNSEVDPTTRLAIHWSRSLCRYRIDRRPTWQNFGPRPDTLILSRLLSEQRKTDAASRCVNSVMTFLLRQPKLAGYRQCRTAD